jgi:hypothetical protein
MISDTQDVNKGSAPKSSEMNRNWRSTVVAKCAGTIWILAFLAANQGFCQTTINLQTQSRNADFSSFPFTRPLTVGASLPATCQVGQLFFSTAIPGANLYACTATDVWTLENATESGGSAAWSGITAPAGNLSLSMGSSTSQFTFGPSTGSSDLFKWTDSASNSGTGALGHFRTASGSSAIPWQADANGVGWRVNSSGQLQGIGSSSAGMIAFPQGSTPSSFPTNSFALYAPPSISSSYQWMFPSADAAGAIVSDGNGTPGHLSMLGFSGTGNLARVTSPTLTSPTLTTPVIGGAENWLFTVGAGGVTANTLCKTDTSFNIVAVTTSDSGAYGVCPTTAAGGTTNYAVARYGQQAVLADGSTTIGDLAAISTTNAGYVHDLGQSASANVPITQRIIGVFKTAAAASGQTAILDLTPAHFGTQVSGTPLAIQQGGTSQGTASTLNCNTNVTCSINGSVATITASSTAAMSFGALTSAKNTQAAMVVGTGASLIPSGSGSVEATSVVDSNQNSVLLAGTSSSAVDQVTITNAAAGGTVDIAATGTDQNIPLTVQGKGAGQLNLNSTNAHVDNAGNLTVSSCNGCGSGSAITLSTTGAGWVAPFGDIAYQINGAPFAANDNVMWQFVCCRGVNIAAKTISFAIVNAQASSHVATAVYADSSGSPGSLLVQSAGASGASQGTVFVALNSTQSLVQGTVYWVAVSTDTLNEAIAEEGTTTFSLQTVLNQPSHPRQGSCANAVTWSAGVPTFPSICGSLTGLGNHRSPQLALLP